MNSPSSLRAELELIESLIRRARYRDAHLRAERLARDNPLSFHARFLHAGMLGDRHEGLTRTRIKGNRRKCVLMLRTLLRGLRGMDAVTRHRVRNEYYWFSRQPLKQYRLGVEAVRRGISKGVYSQGVGAAWHALSLARSGQPQKAARWAKVSADAWRKFLTRDAYYNAYVHLALALGVSGRMIEMERALQKGARLAGRPASYAEFEEIRALIRGLRRAE